MRRTKSTVDYDYATAGIEFATVMCVM